MINAQSNLDVEVIAWGTVAREDVFPPILSTALLVP
jgi:hypothetical protein